MPVYTQPAAPRDQRNGFTMIELMVTLAAVVILASIAAPTLRSFFVRNTFSTIGSDFSGSILRARNEAVSRNTCVTMCISDTVDASVPFCNATEKNWQGGWIVFQNPSCSADYGKDQTFNAVAADDLILARHAGNDAYTLDATSSTPVRKLQFSPTGHSGMGSLERFKATYVPDPALDAQYSFNICLNKMGRTRSISGSASSCNT